MKKINYLLIAAFIALGMSSCVNTKYVPYFQNIDQISLAASKGLYESKVMPKDQLAIFVSTSDPAASRPFNMYVGYGYGNSGSTSSSLTTGSSLGSNNSSLVSYLVDNEGNINYPVFGKIHVVGLTKPQVQAMIEEKLKTYFKDDPDQKPVVTVRTTNWRVTMIGEMGHSTVITSSEEKLSILEALAHAGDLSIYGRRDNVLIIREDANGEKSTHRMNLNDGNLINDPYYYLQQNDVVYVEPTKIKARNSDIGSSTSMIFTVLSSMLSFASLGLTIYSVTRK